MPRLTAIVAWRGDAVTAQSRAPNRCALTLRSTSDGLQPLSWLQLQAQQHADPVRHAPLLEGPLRARDDAGAGHRHRPGGGGGGRVDDGVILVELIHGAAHRIPPDVGVLRRAVAALANVTALAIWSRAGRRRPQHVAWARTATASFEPFSLSGGGLPQLPEIGPVGGAGRRGLRPETFDRLRQIKRRVDPTNRFRFNANIPPA